MAVRIDQVVTRTGDDGQTSLGDGTRTAKDSLRVEAYGSVDEANAALGVLRLHVAGHRALDAVLEQIQHGLFDLGGDLCIPGAPDAPFRIDDRLLGLIEAEIAVLVERQAPLDSFVLPGGSAGAAHAHVVRTTVRRAERRVVALAASETVNPLVVRTLNRLSDYAFVLARHLNDDGRGDVVWRRAR